LYFKPTFNGRSSPSKEFFGKTFSCDHIWILNTTKAFVWNRDEQTCDLMKDMKKLEFDEKRRKWVGTKDCLGCERKMCIPSCNLSVQLVVLLLIITPAKKWMGLWLRYQRCFICRFPWKMQSNMLLFSSLQGLFVWSENKRLLPDQQWLRTNDGIGSKMDHYQKRWNRFCGMDISCIFWNGHFPAF